MHYDARALTSHLTTVTQMMYEILSTNRLKVHSYFRQIRITITTINCKVFLTKLLESYSLFLIIILFLVYLSRLSISLIIPASNYRLLNEQRIKRFVYGRGRGIVRGTFQLSLIILCFKAIWSERVTAWLNNALYSIDLNYIITKINYSQNRTFCMYNLKTPGFDYGA
jgi:hypothetical protein